jgi:hypothetical protein
MKRQEQILNKLTPEEISALAYGFPMPNESYYNNFNDKLESTGATTDVNGAWKPLGVNNFDGFDFVDDSYDNFLTKKSRERNERKKELRDEGKSRKDARKQAKEEIPKDKLKDIAKNVGKGIGRGIVVGALSIPRASYLSLLALNFRGNAYKVMAIVNKENGNSDALLQKLKDKWYKLGGDWDAFVKAGTNGAKRKPLFCGKKCKKALAEKGYKKSSFNGFDDTLDFQTYSNVAGGDDIAIGTWIGLGSAVLTAIGTITATAITSKTKKEEIASAERIAEEENKTLSEADKRAYEVEMAKLSKEVDPKVLITNNPNLTPQEKTMALTQLDEATTKETSQNFKKYALYGGIAIIGIFAISKFMKKK